jgi:glycosyltransferase involved in cell wall biosynthesis
MIEDGVSGLLVPPTAPTSLAAALVRLATDEKLATALGAAARRRVQERFDVRSSARCAAREIREAVGGAHGDR